MRRLILIALLPALLIVMALPLLILAHEVADDPAHNSMCHSPHLGSPTQGWWCDAPAKWQAAYWAHEALKSEPQPRHQSRSGQQPRHHSRSTTQAQPRSVRQTPPPPVSIPPPPEHLDCSIGCIYILP